jgi:VWFA-related protein
VTDLDKSAFTVYEDGQRQSITLFGTDDVPVSLGLVIDNSGSMRSLRASVEHAALAFVRASNPMDDVFVVNFADKPHLDVPMTSDARALEVGITRVDSIGGTALHDAVRMAGDYLREHGSHDRKVLLVITDGIDNASTIPLPQLRKFIEHSETAIFAVGLYSSDSAIAGRARDELDHLTELTGGVATYPASAEEIDSAVIEIAHQIRSQYTIAYTPANQTLDGSYRSIRVKVAGKDGPTVRTRPGYWASPTNARH